MVAGLAAGDIDVIVSAHNPKDADVKRRPFAAAADGAVGLETLLPTALRLYHNDLIDLPSLLRALSTNPADLLRLPGGRLEKGAVADLIVFDPNTPWVVDADLLHSKSKNTPFEESRLQGRVLRTLVAGRDAYTYAEVKAA